VKNEHPMILETDLSFSCARKVYLYFIKHWMYLTYGPTAACWSLKMDAYLEKHTKI